MDPMIILLSTLYTIQKLFLVYPTLATMGALVSQGSTLISEGKAEIGILPGH